MKNVTSLTFGDCFNQPVIGLDLKNVTNLTFGDEFNQPTQSLIDLDFIQTSHKHWLRQKYNHSTFYFVQHFKFKPKLQYGTVNVALPKSKFEHGYHTSNIWYQNISHIVKLPTAVIELDRITSFYQTIKTAINKTKFDNHHFTLEQLYDSVSNDLNVSGQFNIRTDKMLRDCLTLNQNCLICCADVKSLVTMRCCGYALCITCVIQLDKCCNCRANSIIININDSNFIVHGKSIHMLP